jgi:hypothetical protein
MSLGAHTRVTIGRAVQTRQMAPRSMNEAFGPYARLHTSESTSDRVDRLIGRFCVAVLCAAFGLLIASAWIK